MRDDKTRNRWLLSCEAVDDARNLEPLRRADGRAADAPERHWNKFGDVRELWIPLEALHPIRQDGVHALGGKPVPAVPAHGCLLAAAFTPARGAQALALAWRHLRDDPAHVREVRSARRGTQRQD